MSRRPQSALLPLALLVLLPLWPARPVLADAIRIGVGESESVAVPGAITKVQVLNPQVADVSDYSSRGATVVGVGPGQTELIITASGKQVKYSILVSAVEVGRLLRQVRAFLGQLEGIFPRVFGEKVVIDGEALTAEDFGRAQQAVKLFGDNSVKNLVRFRPSAVQQLNQILQRAGLVDVRASLVGGAVFLEGAVGSKEDLRKVEGLIESMPLKVENLVVVGKGRQVLLEVDFVEMRNNADINIGLQLPAAVQMTGTITGSVPLSPKLGPATIDVQMTTPETASTATLHTLVSKGFARLLAQPRLVCGSGEKAKFLVGGEVPIVVVTQTTVSVEWKPFGIKLEAEPIADTLGNVQSTILAEVSEIDRSTQVLNIPGFRTRRVQTTVAVKEGQTIVLSGLYTESQAKAVTKFPLLGHIPILGELFKSREFVDGMTNLAVFITPRVVSPEHQWVRKTIQDIRTGYDGFRDQVGFRILD